MTTPIRTFIDKIARHSNDFLSGFGQAFSLWPSDSLDRYLVPENTASRIYENFARVGGYMDSAMQKVMDEQEKKSQKVG
ncbi:hypothetical protein LZ757_05845 [Xylella fastidiosa subsp. morus]|nr:hypothetical protein [Xylella fastidiosa]MDD0927211.1 hypothetical protein [Xylella fastidiosa subsp. multiplex]UIN27038.1 hypothetical protein IUD23_06795 [Xylella fastidiosa subsp. morus]UIT37721.1 hypothetical protein LZ757_05845 [Xylella fastidiosa subsp. morus]UIT40016.1 hypothetical protein LZ755_05845 [Xylella fastidiosa subsp. morus]UIT43111.1 hypothetical protein LZ758_10155 [Xylella fastidiosa subsp. morus]